MATQGRSILKSWFSAGKKPPESQFWDWIDSFWHKTEDSIPIANITSLDAALQDLQDQITALGSNVTVVSVSGSNSTVLAASILYDVIVIEGTPGNSYSIGATPGGNEILEGSIGSSPEVITLYLYYASQVTIYFTGTFTAKVYKR